MIKTKLFDDKNAEEIFENLISTGIKQKYPNITEETEKRIEYEKSEVKRLHFIPYFLFVRELWGIIKSVDPCAYADGVESGCILNYLLGITDIDPIENGLYFEGFINDRYYKKDYPHYFFNVRESMAKMVCEAIQQEMEIKGINVRTEEHFRWYSIDIHFDGENIKQGFFITLGLSEYADLIHLCEEKTGVDCPAYTDYTDEKVWELFQKEQFENPFIEYAKEHRKSHPHTFMQLADAISGGFFIYDYYSDDQSAFLQSSYAKDGSPHYKEDWMRLVSATLGIDSAKAHYYNRELCRYQLSGKYLSKDKALKEFIADGEKAGCEESTIQKLIDRVNPCAINWKAIVDTLTTQIYKMAYFQAHFHDEYLNAVRTVYQEKLKNRLDDGVVILDLDADGLEPVEIKTGDEGVHFILKIEALRMRNNTVDDFFEVYVYRGLDIPPKLAEVLRINYDDLCKAIRTDEVMKRLSVFLGNLPVITHNVPFVEKFLDFYDQNRLLKRLYCEEVITYFNKIIQPDKPIRTMRSMRKTLQIEQTITDAEAMQKILCMLIDL